MLKSIAIASLLAATAFSAPVLEERQRTQNTTAESPAPGTNSAGTSGDKQLVAQLLEAPTALERINILKDDTAFVFDFANPPKSAVTTGAAGRVVRSSQLTFPALVGNNAAVTMAFIGPCGFNTPHTHPRGTELNLVVEGTLFTQMITENGARPVTNKLETYQMTVFPQGAIHAEFNPTCENATFVAAFPSADPGTLQAATALFGLSDDIVTATFGGAIEGADVERYFNVLPEAIAKGVQECLTTCGIPLRK